MPGFDPLEPFENEQLLRDVLDALARFEYKLYGPIPLRFHRGNPTKYEFDLNLGVVHITEQDCNGLTEIFDHQQALADPNDVLHLSLEGPSEGHDPERSRFSEGARGNRLKQPGFGRFREGSNTTTVRRRRVGPLRESGGIDLDLDWPPPHRPVDPASIRQGGPCVNGDTFGSVCVHELDVSIPRLRLYGRKLDRPGASGFRETDPAPWGLEEDAGRDHTAAAG